MSARNAKSPPSLFSLTGVFLKVGALGFGGPFASIRMMEEEIAQRRGWTTPARFSQWTATCKLLPGPIATQVAIGIGQDFHGRLGGLLAGLGLIAPALASMLALSWAYFGRQAWATGLREQLHALWVLPILTWSILPATSWQLLRSADRKGLPGPWVGVSFAIGALGTGWHPRLEPVWLVGAGLLAALLRGRALRRALAPRAREAASLLLAALFGVHFMGGAFTFGSGFAVIPLLKAHVVDGHAWLTTPQFLDGVLLGQVTPGPVSTTAAFVGWGAAGWAGAWAATLGIFAPAFINMLTWVPLAQSRLERSDRASGFLGGLMPAVAGSLLGLAFHLRDVVLQQGPWRGWGAASALTAVFVLTRRSALVVGLAAVAVFKLLEAF